MAQSGQGWGWGGAETIPAALRNASRAPSQTELWGEGSCKIYRRRECTVFRPLEPEGSGLPQSPGPLPWGTQLQRDQRQLRWASLWGTPGTRGSQLPSWEDPPPPQAADEHGWERQPVLRGTSSFPSAAGVRKPARGQSQGHCARAAKGPRELSHQQPSPSGCQGRPLKSTHPFQPPLSGARRPLHRLRSH